MITSEIIRLYELGQTHKQIADALGINRRTVERRLRRCGAQCRDARFKPQPIRDVFWRHVKLPVGVSDEDCWEWSGGFHVSGYGKMKSGGRTLGAHRVAYEIYRGEIPAGLYVCHRCDCPSCVNPSHLFAGTSKENNNDAINKGRRRRFPVVRNKLVGVRNHASRLVDEQVLQIKSALAGGEPKAALARRYKVSRSSIHRIATGIGWRHVLA